MRLPNWSLNPTSIVERRRRTSQAVPVVEHPLDARWYHGGLAAAAATIFTHPLDLGKTLLQTQTREQGRLSLIGVARKAIERDGVRVLFAGLSASIARQLTYSTVRFAVYDELKRRDSAALADRSPSRRFFSKLGYGIVSGGEFFFSTRIAVFKKKCQLLGKKPDSRRKKTDSTRQAID